MPSTLSKAASPTAKAKGAGRAPLPVGMISAGVLPVGGCGLGRGPPVAPGPTVIQALLRATPKSGGTVAEVSHGWLRVTPAEASVVPSTPGSTTSHSSQWTESTPSQPATEPGLLAWAQSGASSGAAAAVRNYEEEIAKGIGKGECKQEREVRKDLAKLRLSEDNEPLMPFVRCSGCPHIEKWARFHNVWVDSEIEGVEGKYERACWNCDMIREHLPDEQAARYWIIQAAPGYAKKQLVSAAFRKAKLFAKQEFPMMDSNNKLRKVALASMTKIFAPMADAIIRKTKHMEFLGSQADEHKELANRIRNCSDPEEAKKLLAQMDEFISKPSPLLAFADKGAQQWRYQLAATYSDDWVTSTDGGASCRCTSSAGPDTPGRRAWPSSRRNFGERSRPTL